MTLYLQANGTTGYAIPEYRNGTAAQETWCRVKPWEFPEVTGETMSLTQTYGATLSSGILTLE